MLREGSVKSFEGQSEVSLSFGRRVAKSGLMLLVYLVTIAMIIPFLTRNQISQASDSASITRSTSADFAQGTNYNLSTANDQAQISGGYNADWYNDSWTYRQKITIDHTKVVGADQTNFPVLLQITDSGNGVFTHAKNDGTDILFTSSDGKTKLSHEIDTFSASTPVLDVWAKIPTLSSSTDTVLYMYYGNADAVNQQDSTNVWTSFKNAWHFSSTSWTDSTSSAYNGTTSGAVTNPAGKFGNAAGFDGTGGNINLGNKYTTGSLPITIDAWVNMAASNSAIFSSNDGGLYEGVWAVVGANGKMGMSFGDGAGSTSANRRSKDAATAIDLNQWKKVTYIFSGATNMKMYIDGVDAGGAYGGTGGAIAFINNVNYPARIGNRASSGLWPTNGKIDELRYSTVARDSNWIQTEFNNQSSPSTFYSLGDESAQSGYRIYNAADNWYDAAWTNRQKVTIDHTKVSNTDQTDFPVLIKVSGADNKVFSRALSTGKDIAFASTAGVKLSHEIEKFDTTNKELYAWVKIPALSATTDTAIYMYYGNATAVDQQNKADVWSNSYAGVWHMADGSSGTVYDSLTNTSDMAKGLATDPLQTDSSKVGYGQTWVAGTNNIAGTISGTSFFDGTMSGWVKFVGSVPSSRNVLTKDENGWDWRLSVETSTNTVFNFHTPLGSATGATTVQADTWYYVVAVRDHVSNSVKLYLNGSVDGSGSDNRSGGPSGENIVMYMPANGMMDDVRFSSAIRSADWIKTEYTNQNDPTSFVTLSGEEFYDAYHSPTSVAAGSGILDMGWFGGWDQANSFTADVTIPANTLIRFKIRSSAVGGSSDSDWSSWSDLGTATTTGTFAVSKASMPTIASASNRYLQIKALLGTTDGVNTPTLSSYSLFYLADLAAPTSPTTTSANVGGTSVTSASWINYTGNLNVLFSGATDAESGVAGYYVYFGTDSSADPQVDGVYQAHSGAVSDDQVFTKAIAASDDGKYQYLRIQTKDTAGNISSAVQPFEMGYDKTVPTAPTFVSVSPVGYTTSNSFTFSWPAGADPDGANGASGIKYYEYRRGNEGTWSHTLDQNQTSVASLAPYQEGSNAFFVRTVDKAGNYSTGYSQVTYYWSGDAPAKPTNLTVDPSVAAENNFTFSWDKSVVDQGKPAVVGYYYSINQAPTLQNVTYVASTDSHITLGPDHFATKQGENTIYVLAVNEAGNKSFEASYVASATFTCQTVAPPIPGNISISDTSNRAYGLYSLTTKWSAGAGQNAATFDHYIIERSTDGTNFSQLATISSAAYIDASALNSNTVYYYRVKSVDNAGAVSAVSSIVSRMPTGRYQAPPSFLSQPSVSNIKSSSANIAWTTDRASNSIVRYGKSVGDLSASTGQLDSVQNHIVDLLGLESSTTYYYKVQSLDTDRDYPADSALSTAYSFTTLASPSISNVNVSNIGLNSADVTWETTTLAKSFLYYGTNSSFDKELEDISGSNTTKHSVKITGLNHSSRYSFRITGTDTDNNQLVSDNYSFETLPMPRVDNLKLDIVSEKARPSLKVTWTTNVPTSSIVKYSSNDQAGKEEVKAKLVTEHEIVLDNLSDKTNYQIVASGMDSIGNMASSVSSNVVTPNDTKPPVVSDITIETSNVGLNKQDNAQVVVSWKTDEPATSRVEYGVGLGSESYEKQTSEDNNLTTNHVVIISDLEPTSPYHLRINSRDQAGNLAQSPDQTVVSSEVPKSVLRILLNALEGIFGWIKI